MTDVQTLLAINLKKYRKILGFSQAALAEKVNCSTTFIGNIEIKSVSRQPNISTASLRFWALSRPIYSPMEAIQLYRKQLPILPIFTNERLNLKGMSRKPFPGYLATATCKKLINSWTWQ
jgi:transcriptional regulator with XRE-family HTH domain